MYTRGVFFVVFLFVCATVSAGAVDVKGEISGFLGTDGMVHALRLDLEQKLSWAEFKWGFHSELSSGQELGSFATWQIKIPPKGNMQLILNHNLDHYTSSDLFRLINKNNHEGASYFLGLRTKQLNVGFLRGIPLKSLDVVDAVFCETFLDIGPLSLQGLQIRYAGFKESGTAQVMQALGKGGVWEAALAMGWQSDSAALESKGFVFEVTGKGPVLRSNYVWQKIEPGFLSPLAKTNKYTPNRQGWQLELTSVLKSVELGFNLRRHTNLELTRNYNQLSFKLESKKHNTSVEWRLEPTKALVLKYSKEGTLFQIDFFNNTLRSDWQMGEIDWGLRFDGERLITRLEAKFTWGPKWRVIYKYDFRNKRSHGSLLVRKDDKNTHLQLELGQYDKGNMTSGFNNPLGVRIAWGWKF